MTVLIIGAGQAACKPFNRCAKAAMRAALPLSGMRVSALSAPAFVESLFVGQNGA